MKVIYVAGPYSAKTHLGEEQNILNARVAGAEICRLGAVPIIPHSNTAHFDDVRDPEFFYEAGLELVRRSDAVLLLFNWQSSQGSHRERTLAEELGKPVFFSVAQLTAWLQADSASNKDSRDVVRSPADT